MKQKTMQELNEQYKDCPQRENEYTVCGQKMIVVSHFIGERAIMGVLPIKAALEERSVYVTKAG